MARIPDSELERLKSEVSVQRLVQDSGLELKKSGQDFTTCCPFHGDDTASLVVTPAKNQPLQEVEQRVRGTEASWLDFRISQLWGS